MSNLKLTAADLMEIDLVCDRFETAWRMGGAPQIEQFLDFDGSKRAHLLAELIHIDKACRGKHGTELDISVYLQKFPDHASNVRNLLDSPSHKEVRVRAWRLEVMEGPHQGLSRDLAGSGAIHVGRDEDADISLPDDPRCSRSHATIEFSSTWCRVTDTGSKNGVHVNGDRVEESFLRDGDTFLVGRTRIHVTAIRDETTTSNE